MYNVLECVCITTCMLFFLEVYIEINKENLQLEIILIKG